MGEHLVQARSFQRSLGQAGVRGGGLIGTCRWMAEHRPGPHQCRQIEPRADEQAGASHGLPPGTSDGPEAGRSPVLSGDGSLTSGKWLSASLASRRIIDGSGH